jgi:hypothetical protein
MMMDDEIAICDLVETWFAASEEMKDIRLDGRYEIRERRVFHDWAAFETTWR